MIRRWSAEYYYTLLLCSFGKKPICERWIDLWLFLVGIEQSRWVVKYSTVIKHSLTVVLAWARKSSFAEWIKKCITWIFRKNTSLVWPLCWKNNLILVLVLARTWKVGSLLCVLVKFDLSLLSAKGWVACFWDPCRFIQTISSSNCLIQGRTRWINISWAESAPRIVILRYCDTRKNPETAFNNLVWATLVKLQSRCCFIKDGPLWFVGTWSRLILIFWR